MLEDTAGRGLALSTQESLGMKAGGLAGLPLSSSKASPAQPACLTTEHTQVSPKQPHPRLHMKDPGGSVSPAAVDPPPSEAARVQMSTEPCHAQD